MNYKNTDNISEYERLKRKRYLDGIRRYQEKGIRILFDGAEKPEQEWNALFTVSDTGGFYQGSYIQSPTGTLAEIRFEWVCHGAGNTL